MKNVGTINELPFIIYLMVCLFVYLFIYLFIFEVKAKGVVVTYHTGIQSLHDYCSLHLGEMLIQPLFVP